MRLKEDIYNKYWEFIKVSDGGGAYMGLLSNLDEKRWKGSIILFKE